MKFSTLRRAALGLGTSLGLAFGLSACSRDYTVGYVYAPSATSGNVSAYAIDYQTGALTQLTGSPFSSNSQTKGANTVVATPNGSYIYTVSTTDSTVVEWAVGTDGKLYAQNTYNTTGSFPTAAAIDSTGTHLYVTYTYQTGFTNASPGPGGITCFTINTDGTLSSPVNTNVGNNPVAIAVSKPVNSKVFVYVVDQEASPNATVLGFLQNQTSGTLTMLPGSTYNSTLKTYQGYHAGVTPSAIAVDPSGNFAYVTDKTANLLYGFQIQSNVSGDLVPLVSSPWITGLYPVAVTIDPRGKYLYTANYNANTISSFSINSDGSLGGSANAGSVLVATGPTCVTIDPSLGLYLYTSNYLDGSLSGEQLNANTGQLTSVANTPFPASSLVSCAVSVATGSTSGSVINR